MAKIMLPVAQMHGCPWNVLDASGSRIALCGGDSNRDWETFGPAIAAEIVAALNASYDAQIDSELREAGIDMTKANERLKALLDRYRPADPSAEIARLRADVERKDEAMREIDKILASAQPASRNTWCKCPLCSARRISTAALADTVDKQGQTDGT